jgi:AraC-like DNA-binding protein
MMRTHPGPHFLPRLQAKILDWLSAEPQMVERIKRTGKAEGTPDIVTRELVRRARLTPDTLAASLGMSTALMRRQLSAAGAPRTIGQVIRHHRLVVSHRLMQRRVHGDDLNTIAKRAGYKDYRHFSRLFMAVHNTMPSHDMTPTRPAKATVVRTIAHEFQSQQPAQPSRSRLH